MRGVPGTCIVNSMLLWKPLGGTGLKRGAMTPLGRHYHIPTTVTNPALERVPHAGIPVVRRRNVEREE